MCLFIFTSKEPRGDFDEIDDDLSGENAGSEDPCGEADMFV